MSAANGGGGASALPGVADARIAKGIGRLVRGEVLTAQEMQRLREALATLRIGGAE